MTPRRPREFLGAFGLPDPEASEAELDAWAEAVADAFRARIRATDPTSLGRRHPCPRCGSRAVVPVITGLPSPDGEAKVQRGEAVFGGCLPGGEVRDYHCRACGHEWARARTARA